MTTMPRTVVGSVKSEKRKNPCLCGAYNLIGEQKLIQCKMYYTKYYQVPSKARKKKSSAT